VVADAYVLAFIACSLQGSVICLRCGLGRGLSALLGDEEIASTVTAAARRVLTAKDALGLLPC
jgi:hypothetical protein